MKIQQLPQIPKTISQTIGIFLLLHCLIFCDSNTVEGQNYDFKLDSIIATQENGFGFKAFITYDFENETQKNTKYWIIPDKEPYKLRATYFHNNGQLLIDSMFNSSGTKLRVVEHDYTDGKLSLFKRKMFRPIDNPKPYIDEISEYNDAGNIVNSVVNVYNKDDYTLESVHKTFHEYDEFNNRTLFISQIDTMNVSLYADTTKYIFNEENRRIYSLRTGDWFYQGNIDYTEVFYEYDEFGNVSNYEHISYSEFGWSGFKFESIYKDYLELLSEIRYRNNIDGDWDITLVKENEYNENGELIVKNEFHPIERSDGRKYKTLLSYDEGLLTKEERFDFEFDSEKWIKQYYHIDSYTSFNEISELLTYKVDSLGENFYRKINYEYDNNNKKIGKRDFNWVASLNKWELSDVNAIKVNENVLQESVYPPFGINGLTPSLLRNDIYFQDGSSIYDHQSFGIRLDILDLFYSLFRVDQHEYGYFRYETAKYYYSDYSENGDNSDRPGHVYPNPTSDVITIEYPDDWNITETASFELYDFNGKKMLLKDVSNKETINLKNGFSGNYIYYLNGNDKQVVGKIMIK